MGTTPSLSSLASLPMHTPGTGTAKSRFWPQNQSRLPSIAGSMCTKATLGRTSPHKVSTCFRSPLGTQLKIGNDVLVEISQIGKVCHTRCAIYYLAGDCIFPHEGVFGVVLKGGEANAGDEIQVVKLGDATCSFTPAEALEEIEQARQKGTL
jgi:hypothetical protein